jgi:hypothetical protein
MRKINVTHRRTLLAGFAVLGNTGVFQQQVQHMTVVFQQIIAGKAGGETFRHFFDLIVFQPGVNDLELLSQYWP